MLLRYVSSHLLPRRMCAELNEAHIVALEFVFLLDIYRFVILIRNSVKFLGMECVTSLTLAVLYRSYAGCDFKTFKFFHLMYVTNKY